MNWEQIDRIEQMKGSEAKAILTMVAAGEWLSVKDLHTLSGMTKKTCRKAVESNAVRKHVSELLTPQRERTLQELMKVVDEYQKELENLKPKNEQEPELETVKEDAEDIG